ncbi:MAG: MBL fold metallo-hydrolase, partial [Acidimicrobiia bacterium]|nr:MBL fold metallo-hydrolase [Acidimicrobiia bacterium]
GPAELLERPYLQPIYDDPEFIVRNVWRLYGGWWDGDPSHLKPAPETDVAVELAALAGGAARLAERAVEIADAGDLRLAAHLAELAGRAAPYDRAVLDARAEVYRRRAAAERSLMARNTFNWAAGRDAP